MGRLEFVFDFAVEKRVDHSLLRSPQVPLSWLALLLLGVAPHLS